MTPVPGAPVLPSVSEALGVACQQVGLDPRHARLIHHYANAVFLLPSERVVARVAHASGRAYVAQTAVEVTHWLVTEHGFPATQPLPGLPVVRVFDDTVVSFWVYYPQPSTPADVTSSDLAAVIRRLHDLPEPPVRLPAWRPLTSLETTVRAVTPSACFSPEDRDWVLRRIDDVRSGLAALHWPLGHGLIHGDAWAGNLLVDPTRDPAVILGDWDGVAYGPREIDLAPTWHAAARYGRGQAWADRFADVYGHDLAAWPGHSLLMQLRDLMQLTGPLRRVTPGSVFEDALRQRLAGIRSGDRSAWRPLTGT